MTIPGTRKALRKRIVELEAENALLLDKTFFCRPEKPIIVWLLANVTGNQWRWYWRVLGSGYFWFDGGACWEFTESTLVDERYSYPVAIALWKVESERLKREKQSRNRQRA